MPRFLLFLCLIAGTAAGQLTTEQKRQDLQSLAATFDKQYGPYQWKRDRIGFDLLNIAPWLSRAADTQNDLDFYEVMAEYVASLSDTHSLYLLPSRFSAGMGFTVDIFDGKVLIDSLSRGRLPLASFPISVGDELVSVDGVAMADLIPKYAQYHHYATPRASARYSANSVVNRFQIYNPYAVNVPATSALVFNRATGGPITLTVPWGRAGLPLNSIDPAPTPNSVRARASTSPGAVAKDLLEQLRNATDPVPEAITGYGAFNPVFSLPTEFVQRLGQKANDQFLSGTFPSGARTFGFLRIASYSPSSSSVALAQFRAEMAYFQQNVDGLIIDQMRNPGGSVCYAQNIVASLMPGEFRALGFEVRATRNVLLNAYSALNNALAFGPQTDAEQYQLIYDNVLAAYQANRANTAAMPLCGSTLTAQPATDSTGTVISYTKPLVFLIDEFSTSGGDAVPAMLQDNGRGVLVGYNTNGAGGTVGDGFSAGAFSEGTANITLSLMARKGPVDSAYGPTIYVENVGVRPDVTLDYMTRDNLMNGGRTFLSQVIDVLNQQIQ